MFDEKLKSAVLEELTWEPSVSPSNIGVIAKDGVVTLTGHVGTFAEKHAAETATRRVKGVKAVAEEIEVRLPFESKRADDQIAAAAVDRLTWDVAVPKAIGVKVEKGWVTLDGQVDWHYQSEAAVRAVRNLFGVVGVSNLITIKPAVYTAKIGDNIMHALHRSWFFDPAIVVNADGGKVRLSGTVHSPYDRAIAGTTAWAAPGATSVENDILVM